MATVGLKIAAARRPGIRSRLPTRWPRASSATPKRRMKAPTLASNRLACLHDNYRRHGLVNAKTKARSRNAEDAILKAGTPASATLLLQLLSGTGGGIFFGRLWPRARLWAATGDRQPSPDQAVHDTPGRSARTA